MSPRNKRTIILVAGLILALQVLIACNMPTGSPTLSPAERIYTEAAQTLRAQLTQVSGPPATGGATPAPPSAQTPVPPTSGATPAGATPGATGTAGACDRARFIEDVTVPDNSEVNPGQIFIKTWRLENAGDCPWTANYALVVEGDDELGAPQSVSIPPAGDTIEPGERVDVSVTLTAPDEPGVYRTDFKLRNANGQVFGTGEDGSQPVWVQVDVRGEDDDAAAAADSLDFVARAASAEWVSGVGNNVTNTLTYNGSDDDPNGLAAVKDGIRLETGAESGKILVTVPKRDQDGFIRGVYPAYRVQRGDVLRARLGFWTPGGNCAGGGRVEFEVQVREDDEVRSLGSWEAACDGALQPIELDLGSLRGRTVQFILLVRTNGAWQDDWAVWNSPYIDN